MDPVPGAGGQGMVEVEVEGNKYQVPAELKGAFMAQSDYSKNMAKYKNDREALDAQSEEFKDVVQLGADIDQLIASNPKAREVLEALMDNKNVSVGDVTPAPGAGKPPAGGGDDKLQSVLDRLSKMEEANKLLVAQINHGKATDRALESAKVFVNKEMGIVVDDSLMDQVEKLKKTKNPHVFMFAAADRERAIQAAKEEGLNEGYDQGYNDRIRKKDSTPPMSSGSGQPTKGTVTGRTSTENAFKRLKAEGKMD
jgi:hypothetical protein